MNIISRLVQSDVTNHPALFVRNPGWSAVFDIDGPKAIETRRKFYDMAVAEKSLIASFHYPFPSLGHAEKDGTSYRLGADRPGTHRSELCGTEQSLISPAFARCHSVAD